MDIVAGKIEVIEGDHTSGTIVHQSNPKYIMSYLKLVDNLFDDLSTSTRTIAK